MIYDISDILVSCVLFTGLFVSFSGMYAAVSVCVVDKLWYIKQKGIWNTVCMAGDVTALSMSWFYIHN